LRHVFLISTTISSERADCLSEWYLDVVKVCETPSTKTDCCWSRSVMVLSVFVGYDDQARERRTVDRSLWHESQL